MKELFSENNESILENFEIILDRAKSEKTALANCIDYYFCLVEDENTEISIEEIVELAESYGYDFSEFEQKVKENIYEL